MNIENGEYTICNIGLNTNWNDIILIPSILSLSK